ncbi:MAG: hypothetical protein HFH75_04065 [Lachnospiraceae bacterium]|jgi:hypothetical protein|nr:hypothetical protein [Lachnospiraceae bacterium]
MENRRKIFCAIGIVLEKEWRNEGKRAMYLRQIDENDRQKNNKKSLFCTAVLLAAAAGVLAAGVKAEAAPASEPSAAQERPKEEVQTANQYIIAQDGTGDFTTIQEGVDNASNGDTLIVYPGIYNEAVQVIGKEVNITGIDRDRCILQYDTISYRTAPLTVAAGRISNLTLHGRSSGTGQVVLTEEEIAKINSELIGDSWDRQKNYRGYAVHVDSNFLYGRTVSFENCRIISENNHAAGIGTRGNSVIRFENCELISMGGGSSIYMHDPITTEMSGKASLVVKDCYLASYMCPYVMTFQSYLPENNSFDLTFQNTRVSAVEYAYDGSYTALNVNTSFDVETLETLEKAGGLYVTGLSSSAEELVHKMTLNDMMQYVEELEKALETGDAASVVTISLPEGITRIGYIEDENIADLIVPSGLVKHQVIAIYNRSNQPGNGWCGLDNAYLTADSYGNTLVEMNAVTTPGIADGVPPLYTSAPGGAH